MKSMKHDKEMSFINVTQKYPNGTLKTDDQGNTKVHKKKTNKLMNLMTKTLIDASGFSPNDL